MIARRASVFAASLIAAAGLGLVGAFAFGAAAHTGELAAQSGSATFVDPTGDGNGAADITTITVGDDPATETVQLTVTANGLHALETEKPKVAVYLDTDENAATGAGSGDGAGAEYVLYYDYETDGWGWDLAHWDGASWQELPHAQTMSFTGGGDTLAWQLARADLGGTSGFNFWVRSGLRGNNSTVGSDVVGGDRAPDGGVRSYDLSSLTPPATTSPEPPPVSPTAVKPHIAAPTTTPRKAVAGKRLTVMFPVTRSDTGAPLTRGKMVCDPSVRGKVIRHSESFRNGTARLTFTIPRTAKGKPLTVKVTINLGSRSATRIATFHVG
jgi:hypothetical protein